MKLRESNAVRANGTVSRLVLEDLDLVSVPLW